MLLAHLFHIDHTSFQRMTRIAMSVNSGKRSAMSKINGDKKRTNIKDRKKEKMRLKIRELKLAHPGLINAILKNEVLVPAVK